MAEQDTGDEVTLLAVTRDRRHDLAKVQIRREGAILALLRDGPGRLRLLKQQARAAATTIQRGNARQGLARGLAAVPPASKVTGWPGHGRIPVPVSP
jgi:hypothetical protein